MAEYLEELTALAEQQAERILKEQDEFLRSRPSHRPLARRIKVLMACYCAPDARRNGDRGLLLAACSLAEALADQQGPIGLFDGDNLQSPPDTAFTANDVLDTLRLLQLRVPLGRGPVSPGYEEFHGGGSGSGEDPAVRLKRMLDTCADRLDAPLRTGGVHTPNHRWELCQALAELDARRPDPARRARIDQWLGEGIDVDADGQYSERSANYAAYVTNRSLLVLARELGRPELEEVVVRNLEAVVAMTGPAGDVETIHSRRQDQLFTVPLSLFQHQLRLVSVARGRGDLAWWWQRAWSMGIPDPGDDLSNALLDPRCTAPLPEPIAPAAGERVFRSGLIVRRRAGQYLCVNAGSDWPAFRCTASGLACNPTFLHAWVGDVEIRSVRLSRAFFGLGPFRAQSLSRVVADGAVCYVLNEEVSANYYQPLPERMRREDADYALEHEGRFAAAMAFSQRERDTLTLSTEISVTPQPDGFDVTVTTHGPDTRTCLEVALPDLPAAGVTRFTSDMWVPDGDQVIWGEGEHALGITIAGDLSSSAPFYEPGEELRHGGGTDALGGQRLYVSARVPGELRLRFRSLPRSEPDSTAVSRSARNHSEGNRS